MTTLIDLKKSLKALTGDVQFCYPNWSASGFIQIKGLASFLTHSITTAYWTWESYQNPISLKSWQKKAALSVQDQLDKEMRWASSFIQTMTTKPPSTHCEDHKRLIYLQAIASSINDTSEQLKLYMQTELDTQYNSFGIDELKKLPEKIKPFQIFLHWCAFTDFPFPYSSFQEFFCSNKPLDSKTDVALKNWIQDFNAKVKQLQLTPDRRIDFEKFQNLLLWLLTHFQQNNSVFSSLCFALHTAGLEIFSITDFGYAQKRQKQIEVKKIGNYNLKECKYNAYGKCIYETEQNTWIAFYTHNPLAILAEHGAKGLKPGVSYPTIKKVDIENHILVLSPPENLTVFNPSNISHQNALIQKIKLMVDGQFTQLLTKEALRVSESMLYHLDYVSDVEGLRHDILEPLLFELITDFETLSNIYIVSNLNKQKKLDEFTSKVILCFIDKLKNPTHPLWNDNEKKLEIFITESLPDKSFGIEEMKMYQGLLIDVRKTIRYCQEQVKKTYPNVYEDNEFVVLVGLIIMMTRKSKMLCMQLPSCFQTKVLDLTKKMANRFAAIFLIGQRGLLDELRFTIIRKKEQEKSNEIIQRMIEQTEKYDQRLFDWELIEEPFDQISFDWDIIKDPDIEFLITHKDSKNLHDLANYVLCATYYTLVNFIKQNTQYDPVHIFVHVRKTISLVKGFCGNMKFLEENIKENAVLSSTIKQNEEHALEASSSKFVSDVETIFELIPYNDLQEDPSPITENK